MTCCIRCEVMNPCHLMLHDIDKIPLGVGQEYDDTKPPGWPESLQIIVERSNTISTARIGKILYQSIWHDTAPSHSNKSVAEQVSLLVLSGEI